MNSVCCRFCKRLADPARAPWDQALWETPSFVVTPTLGSIVEGWLLVTTRQHHLCMGALTPPVQIELRAVVEAASHIVRQHYGPVAVFEHGPGRSHQQVGCGVDHAHMHIVPTTCDLIAGARQHLPEHVHWESTNGYARMNQHYQAQQSYLYLEQWNRKLVLASAHLPSQLFRKVIALHTGAPDAWNWREHPFQERAEATVLRLSRSFRRLGSWSNVIAK